MQLSKKRLTSKEFALIEELVEWNTKIKDIVWIIGSEKAELYAKHCYKELGIRPPNGIPGSATAKSIKLGVRMQYSALAVEYINAIKRGNARNDAMLTVYRLFWKEFKNQKSIAKSSIWISTSKNIDCKIEELILCGACGGQYLISSSVAQYCNEVCLWCNHSMPMHLFSKYVNSQ